MQPRMNSSNYKKIAVSAQIFQLAALNRLHYYCNYHFIVINDINTSP